MDFWKDGRTQRRWLLRFALAVGILLLPVAILALFNRPSADDYGYGLRAHEALRNAGGDPAALLRAAWDTNVYFFENWQGLYVSGFLLALQPGIFGSKMYALTPLCVLVPLLACLWGAARLTVRRLAPEQKYLPWFLALLFTFAFVQGMPNPVEGLFWFNGAMNYIPFFSLAVLDAAIVWRLTLPAPRAEKQKLACAGVVIGLVIGGGHQVVTALVLLILLAASVRGAAGRNFWPLFPLAAAALGLAVNLTAPGTAVRQAALAGAGLGEAVVKSFALAAMQLVRWLDVPLLCLLALLAPALAYLARSSALPDGAFRRPWRGAAFTYVLLWGMLFLPSYTMGGIGAGRLINVVWMTFVLGLAVTEFLALGWLQRVRGISLRGAARVLHRYARRLPAVCAAMLLCMACIGTHTVKEGQDNHFGTSVEALYELLDGSAARYAAAFDAREETILAAGETGDAVISPLPADAHAWLLFFTDMAPGRDPWGLAAYYGVGTVTVEQAEN